MLRALSLWRDIAHFSIGPVRMRAQRIGAFRGEPLEHDELLIVRSITLGFHDLQGRARGSLPLY